MGVCAILDLRRLNNSLYRGKFMMLMLKSIISQVQEGGLFRHRWLEGCQLPHSETQEVPQVHLRWKGVPIQGSTLRDSTKCMYVALALLRLQGIRILNYLDDWLILASSREQVIRHRDSLLLRLHALALWLNGQKSVLAPVQQTIFLEVCLDSTSM